MKSSDAPNPPRSIGAAAAAFGLETHVLRFWEEKALLHPARDPGGRRVYGDGDMVSIAVIVRSRAAGMSLDRIAVLLRRDPGHARHTVLAEHIAELDARIHEMEMARAMAVHAFECDAHDITTCPAFRATIADVLAGGTYPAREPTSGAGTRRRS